MARKGFGVDVLVDQLLSKDTPCCIHGPTLLFERLSAKDSSVTERFYACSACRDRHECPFFHRVGDRISEAKRSAWEQKISDSKPKFSHEQFYSRLKAIRKQDPNSRQFCSDCSIFILNNKEFAEHQNHQIITGIIDDHLECPTKLLPPLQCNKSNAQYLFSNAALDFLISLLRKLKAKRVLCIGAPRVHEALCQQALNPTKEQGIIHSFLLDMDTRLQQFFPPVKLCRYNMFNHHFFDGASAKESYTAFLRGDGLDDPGDLFIAMDPPFGGLIDALVFNLKRIWDDSQAVNCTGFEKPRVLWFFPYFLESRIIESLPDFTMLDYKVDYANHADFKGKDLGGSRHDSPVRIFTNIAPDEVVLPTEEGYRFCAICKRHVSQENQHCKKCNSCTSKDGRTYIHCDKCQRCVKPSKSHCDTCGFCVLPGHKCGESMGGCFICGNLSHKKADCPEKHSSFETVKKRKKSIDMPRRKKMRTSNLNS